MFRFTHALVILGVTFASPTPRDEKFQDLRIIGGQDANINNHPWQISLQSRGSHFCGGFLISSTWVVTAAHCLGKEDSSSLNILAGTSNRSSGGQTVNVRRYIMHPQYDENTYNNDIALVELSSSVTFSESVRAAILPVAGQVLPDNTPITIIGWGNTKIKGEFSDTLKEISVSTINRSACRVAFTGTNTEITTHMFCAGLLGVGGKDSCLGDSGGPAEINGEIVGITSWGISCADPNFPGVYAKVAVFRDWIYINTGI